VKLYEFPTSGNCYKARLALTQGGKAFERVEMGRNDGSIKTDAFKKISPSARVPALEVAPGKVLVESSAIVYFAGKGTPLVPEDPYEQAEIVRWMSFEQDSVLPTIALARFIKKMLGLPREKEAEFKAKQEGAANALRIMERHLASHEFFVGERYTVADIALYAYTHLAPEGGIDLAPYPNVQAWLARVRAQPKHVEIYG
jgi:glutathione S-transferase